MRVAFCIYCRAVNAMYGTVAEDLVARTGAGLDMIIMHSREMQELLFEFYAFTILSRITLDELRKYVAPTFATPAANLPKLRD